jgi:hypothetical protein
MNFQEFDKIPRLSRECIITEKIDGTNAQVAIFNEYEMEDQLGQNGILKVPVMGINYYLMTGSRTRWIWPEQDNAGFAAWAWKHAEELVTGLGPGIHYGEWWGQGIQRGYGLKEKRFSLFNVSRWTDDVRPSCCHVVPTLYWGLFDTEYIEMVLGQLEDNGSHAAPGYKDPEGIVIFHVPSGYLFKKTIKNDEKPKGQVKE